LRRDGAVPTSRYQDYGLSAHGNVTRFPNGVELNRATGVPRIPAELAQSFQEHNTYDQSGRLVQVDGYAGTRSLYTRDAQGFHVPTADGIITQARDGSITFRSNRPARASAALPPLEIGDSARERRDLEDLFNTLDRCGRNSDPLCGIEDELDADRRAQDSRGRRH
jgi:hypothetical protein